MEMTDEKVRAKVVKRSAPIRTESKNQDQRNKNVKHFSVGNARIAVKPADGVVKSETKVYNPGQNGKSMEVVKVVAHDSRVGAHVVVPVFVSDEVEALFADSVKKKILEQSRSEKNQNAGVSSKFKRSIRAIIDCEP